MNNKAYAIIILLIASCTAHCTQKKAALAPKKVTFKPGASLVVYQEETNAHIKTSFFPQATLKGWPDLWTNIIIPYIGLPSIAPTLWAGCLQASEDLAPPNAPQPPAQRCSTPMPTLRVQRNMVTIKHAKTATNPVKQVLLTHGHLGGFKTAKLNRVGKKVVTTGNDDNVCVFDCRTGVKKVVLKTKGKHFQRAQFSPDGTHIIAASADNTVHVCDTDGQNVHTLSGNKVAIESAQLTPLNSLAVTTARQDDAIVWNVQTGRPIKHLEHRDPDMVPKIMADGTIKTMGREGRLVWKSPFQTTPLTLPQMIFLSLLECPRRSQNPVSILALARNHKQSYAEFKAILESFNQTDIKAATIRSIYKIKQTPAWARARK